MTCEALTHGPHNPECTCPVVVGEFLNSIPEAAGEFCMEDLERIEAAAMGPLSPSIPVTHYSDFLFIIDERQPKPVNPPASRFIPSKKSQPWRRRQ